MFHGRKVSLYERIRILDAQKHTDPANPDQEHSTLPVTYFTLFKNFESSPKKRLSQQNPASVQLEAKRLNKMINNFTS
jgi:hypothetical protein